MALEVKNTKTANAETLPVLMLVYGAGGSGKTTFGATAPNHLIVDLEGGTKYLKQRGIDANYVNIKSWSDMKDVITLMKDYDTIVIDPLGELMEKLKRHMVALNNKKLVQSDGSPSAAGWGWLKDTLAGYIKILRDSGKHVLIIAHVEEGQDGENMIKRPKVQTKLKEDVVNMLDQTGLMVKVKTDQKDENGDDIYKHMILFDANDDRYVAKDRSDQLGKMVPADFKLLIKAIQGTEVFPWSSDGARERFEAECEETPAEEPADEPAPAEEPQNEPEESEDDGLTVEEVEEAMNPKKTAAKKAEAKKTTK